MRGDENASKNNIKCVQDKIEKNPFTYGFAVVKLYQNHIKLSDFSILITISYIISSRINIFDQCSEKGLQMLANFRRSDFLGLKFDQFVFKTCLWNPLHQS